ncbi:MULTISPECIES: hypothetical protein [Enterobacteriaceae]|nr:MULTISPECIES: hypothetical protein [Enterobacteriaceae]GAL47308.1 hypothetical protein CIWKM_21_00120 [Citrobacter werkmanii NBRC 105721]
MDSIFKAVVLFVNASKMTQVLTLVFLLLVLAIVKTLMSGG